MSVDSFDKVKRKMLRETSHIDCKGERLEVIYNKIGDTYGAKNCNFGPTKTVLLNMSSLMTEGLTENQAFSKVVDDLCYLTANNLDNNLDNNVVSLKDKLAQAKQALSEVKVADNPKRKI